MEMAASPALPSPRFETRSEQWPSLSHFTSDVAPNYGLIYPVSTDI